ncbi:hypothetical protein GCM10010385_47960 [Streptomyces geysiriensis]|nr:hypothetical protein GCM10010385_47960 [Streptomyces geysiriensis]
MTPPPGQPAREAVGSSGGFGQGRRRDVEDRGEPTGDGTVEVVVMEEGWGSWASGGAVGGGWSGQGQDRSDDLAEH